MKIGEWVCQSVYMNVPYKKPVPYSGEECKAVFDAIVVMRDDAHAAICATPAVALEVHGFLKGKKATAHPAFTNKLTDNSEAQRRVVADGVLTTSRGPGTAFEFALALVKQLYGEAKMEEVAGPMVMYDGWKESVDGAGR